MFKRAPEQMYRALTLHNNVIRHAKYVNCGSIIQQEGDSFTLAFHTAFDAVAFCLQVCSVDKGWLNGRAGGRAGGRVGGWGLAGNNSSSRSSGRRVTHSHWPSTQHLMQRGFVPPGELRYDRLASKETPGQVAMCGCVVGALQCTPAGSSSSTSEGSQPSFAQTQQAQDRLRWP
jgi:hypothetical protein